MQTSASIRSRAPLRLGLAGGGTDVPPYCDEFGGAILNATIGLYAYATITPTDDGIVRLISHDQGQEASYSMASEPPLDGKLDLLKIAHRHAMRKFNEGKPRSLTLSTRVDVPMGSGLGASSTLMVAVIRAYAEWFGQPVDDYDLAHTAFVIERQEAGLKGGSQDQYAAAFGGFNFMEFGAKGFVLVNPLRIRPGAVAELEASALLFYTGASRASASIIAEQANNVHTGNPDALRAMHQIKQEALHMKEALLRSDFPFLYSILQRSWEAKRKMASSIVNDRLERLHNRAMEAGAKCARISGAGGGGFMVVFADPMEREKIARALLTEQPNGMIFPCHFTSAGADAWKVR